MSLGPSTALDCVRLRSCCCGRHVGRRRCVRREEQSVASQNEQNKTRAHTRTLTRTSTRARCRTRTRTHSHTRSAVSHSYTHSYTRTLTHRTATGTRARTRALPHCHSHSHPHCHSHSHSHCHSHCHSHSHSHPRTPALTFDFVAQVEAPDLRNASRRDLLTVGVEALLPTAAARARATVTSPRHRMTTKSS